MSSRQRSRLRKLQEQHDGDDVDDESSDDDEQVQTSKPSVFQMFSDSDSSSEEEEEESESMQQDRPAELQQSNQDASKDVDGELESEDEDLVLEEAIRRAELEKGEQVSEDGVGDDFWVVEKRTLNPDVELRRQFGQAVRRVDAGSASAVRGQTQRGRNRRSAKGRGVPVKVHQYLFMTPEAEWIMPPSYHSGAGAKMSQLEDGLFTFQASAMYKQAQRLYLQCANSHDPNTIVQLLQEHPFHVDALLQMSEVYIATGNYETSELMLRRALFALESWFHPAFRNGLFLNKCRLLVPQGDLDTHDESDDSCGLNHSFLRAIFRSAQFSSRRGCHDTAFSLAKVIQSLSRPQDPNRLVLCIDFFALQARDPQFVLDMLDADKGHLNAMEVSVALRTCNAEQQSQGANAGLESLFPNLAYSRALAAHVVGDEEAARSHLRFALASFPGFINLLAAECSEQVDATGEPWKSVLNKCRQHEESLEDAIGCDSIARERLYKLYLTRSKALWLSTWNTEQHDGGSNLEWLKAALEQVLIHSSDTEAWDTLVAARSTRVVPDLVEDHYCGARVSDFTPDIQTVPAMEDDMRQQNRPRRAEPNVNLDANALALFFQTLMPWARLPERNREVHEDDEAMYDDQE